MCYANMSTVHPNTLKVNQKRFMNKNSSITDHHRHQPVLDLTPLPLSNRNRTAPLEMNGHG